MSGGSSRRTDAARAAPERLCVAALLAVLGASAIADGESLARPGTLDSRIRVVAFDAGQVYRLPAFVGYQIHLQLEDGEQFAGLAAGDLEGLAVSSRDHHVFLKPKAPRVATNLTLLTDRRAYQFEYSAETRRPDPAHEAVIYSLRFEYAAVRDAKGPLAEAEPARLEAALRTPVRSRNFDYGYCGPRALKPVSAFDDGVQLQVRFAPGADLPAFFAREPDGTESLVNFTVESDHVIVHRLTHELILRRGRLRGCLVNRAAPQTGFALDSGTITPAVQRRLQRVAP